MRTFYTRKVEEMQRKADAQMRSLKRGGDAAAGGFNETDNHTGTDGNSSKNGNNGDDNNGIDNEFSDEKKGNDETDNNSGISEIQGLKIHYERQLSALQSELRTTNEQLSALRASVSPTSLSPDFSVNKVNLEQLRTAETELIKLQFMKESEQKLQNEREKWRGQQDENNENEKKNEQRKERERQEDKDRRDELKGRLRDEETKVSQLSSEVLRLQARLEGPKTPQMSQFMVRAAEKRSRLYVAVR